MCGRFTNHWTWQQLHEVSQPFWEPTSDHPDPSPRYNIAPTQEVPVFCRQANETELVTMRWGFPRPNTAPAQGVVINARSETASTKPMFRDALRARRCLVPASGFYEWEKQGDGTKQPWYLTPDNAPVCYFAGIYNERAETPVFAVLTYETPAGFEPAIHHRMPAVVTPSHANAWLDCDPSADPSAILAPGGAAAPFGALETFPVRAHPVSKAVSSAANDRPDLIDPVSTDPGLFG